VGYHRPRTKDKDEWGKFDFPTQNETVFSEIVFVRLTSDHLFAYQQEQSASAMSCS